MSIINKLKPQNYEFKKDAKYSSLNLPKGSHYGLLAQNIEQVLPNLVSEAPHELRNNKAIAAIRPTADGKPLPAIVEQKEGKESINIKAVNYVELIPIMVKAMQEQDLKIQEQQKQNDDLKKEIVELKSQVRAITKQGGSITSNTTAFLKQNAPNPSDNNTVISYYAPNETKNAQIIVSDINGSVIKTFTLSKGEGQVTLRRGELPTGTYNYTLYVNNSKIDTKQMIVIK